jgi:hypothetical protein
MTRLKRPAAYFGGFIILQALALLAAGSAVAANDPVPSSRFDPAKCWRSREIEAGMKGYGITVFQDTKIERFEVEILGVLHNEYSETDLILARCSGGPLAKTGVIAGMSGSPIFVGDKIVGALAYAWAYSTEAIAGITPIENMLPVLDLPPTERSGASTGNPPERSPWSGETNSTPPDWPEKFSSFLKKDYASALSGSTGAHSGTSPRTEESLSFAWGDWFAKPLTGPLKIDSPRGWIPLATPMSVGGLSGDNYERIASLMTSVGFQPVAGGGPGGSEKVAVKLEPGSALGVAMVSGDLNLTGIGTVTYMDGDRVLGFGHPMFMDGPTDLPMTTAFINTILPSSRLSTKVGSLVEVVGALEQDRQPAIGGVVGSKANTVPVHVRILNQAAGSDRQFDYDVARHRFFTSRFAMLAVLDAFDVAARGFRDSAADFTLTIRAKGKTPVVVRDQVSSTMGTSFEIAMTIAAAVDLLMLNPYERVEIEGIDIEVSVVDRLRRGSIEWIRVDSQEIEQGQPLRVSVAIRPFLGEVQVVRHILELPKDIQLGQAQLSVVDAMSYITEIQRQNPDRFRSRSLDDMIRLINEPYRNDELFLSLNAMAPGASFNGKEMADLPTSVLRVMADSAERGTGMFLMNEPLAMNRLAVGTPLAGNQNILIEIGPRKAGRIN